MPPPKRAPRAAIVQDADRTTLPALVVNDGRRAAAVAAAAAYDFPARELQLVGVTGTNGKTTTVNLLRHLLDDDTARSASIGTLGVLVGSDGVPLDGGGGLTTPGPIELQRIFRALRDQGVAARRDGGLVALADQRRVEGVLFDVAVVHQLHARPPRLSRHDGAVLRREGDAARSTSCRTARSYRTSTIRRGINCGQSVGESDSASACRPPKFMRRSIRFSPRGSEWTICLGQRAARGAAAA